MYIKSPQCTLQMSYNFICQLCLIKAEILKNVLSIIACLLAELRFISFMFHWSFCWYFSHPFPMIWSSPKIKITCQVLFTTWHIMLCLNQMISKLVWKEILSSWFGTLLNLLPTRCQCFFWKHFLYANSTVCSLKIFTVLTSVGDRSRKLYGHSEMDKQGVYQRYSFWRGYFPQLFT